MSLDAKLKLLVINDNHGEICELEEKGRKRLHFPRSRFHEYLSYFRRLNVVLSSPIHGLSSGKSTRIGDLNVVARPVYGNHLWFYTFFPYHIARHFKCLWRQTNNADVIMIVIPAATAWTSYVCARLRKKPVVTYCVGSILTQLRYDKSSISLLKGVVARLESWVYSKICRNSLCNFVLGRCLIEELGIEKYHNVFTFTSLVQDSDLQVADTYGSYQNKGNSVDLRIVTACRISYEKNIDILVYAVMDLLQRGLKLRVVIVGDGPEKSRLVSLVSRLGLEGVVEFKGWLPREEVLREVVLADVFALTSLSEGVPKVVVDAMCCKTVVVSSDVGGVPDILGMKSERGILFASGSKAELVDAMQYVVDNPDEIQTMVRNAYEYVANHTATKESERIQQVITEMIEERCEYAG